MALLHATQSHEPAKDVTPFPSLDLLEGSVSSPRLRTTPVGDLLVLRASSGFVIRWPGCSISRDLRREDHTICTAVAPDGVFTVRRYGNRPLDGPAPSAQVQLPESANLQVSPTCFSRTRDREPTRVAAVRLHALAHQRAINLGDPGVLKVTRGTTEPQVRPHTRPCTTDSQADSS